MATLLSLAGDRNHNPFLFRIDSGWEVSNLDSVVKFNCWGDEDKLNVKVCRTYPTVGSDNFSTLDGKEYSLPLVVRLKNSGKASAGSIHIISIRLPTVNYPIKVRYLSKII